MKQFIMDEIESSKTSDWVVVRQLHTTIYSTSVDLVGVLSIMKSEVNNTVLVLLNGGTVILSAKDKEDIVLLLKYL